MDSTNERFPKAIADIWFAIKNEVIWAHGRWIIYRQLYGTSSERVEILNRSAPDFFNIVQHIFLHDIQLTLSKLGDPVESRGEKNLTLKALGQAIHELGETQLFATLTPLISRFDRACVKLRHRRNKSIAHLDLRTMLGAKVTPLAGPSRKEIEDALDALRGVMNCIELHFIESQTFYEELIMQTDGVHLIRMLQRGLRYKDLVRTKVIPPDDIRKVFSERSKPTHDTNQIDLT